MNRRSFLRGIFGVGAAGALGVAVAEMRSPVEAARRGQTGPIPQCTGLFVKDCLTCQCYCPAPNITCGPNKCCEAGAETCEVDGSTYTCVAIPE